MLGRFLRDATVFVAAVIDPDVQPGALIGAVDVLFPIPADGLDVGGRGGEARNLLLHLPALPLPGHGALVGDVPEAVRAKLTVRQQHMRVDVPVILPLPRGVDRHIGGDTVPLDERGR